MIYNPYASYPRDGGPAFPSTNDANKEYNYLHAGMTVRTYAAIEAMNALLVQNDVITIDIIAKKAVLIADALIAELYE